MPKATRRAGHKRYDAGPWSVKFVQITAAGRKSRPIISNARGKRVRASKPANAVLMGAAPELYEALEALEDSARFLLGVLRCEHPLVKEPPELARAAELLGRVRRELLWA
jgi:hypothetical protein